MLGAILLHNDAFNLAAEVIDSARFLPRRAPPHLRQDGQARRARRRDRSGHAEGGAGAIRRARRSRRPRLHRGAGRRRAALDQRRALRADHQREGDAPQPDLLRQQDSRRPPTRPKRTPTSSSTRPSTRSSPSPTTRSATASSRCATWRSRSLDTIEKLHARKELVTGVPTGFTDLDEMTSGLQPVGPDHRRGAAVDGEDQPGAEHRAARRHQDRHDRRRVQPRDVEGTAVPAHADRRGADRRAPAARRVSRRARLGQAGAGDRDAQRGEDLHRRHAVDRRPRDARQVPPAGVRARPRTW